MLKLADIEGITDRMQNAVSLDQGKPGFLRELDRVRTAIESCLAEESASGTSEENEVLLAQILQLSELYAQLKEWEASVGVLLSILTMQSQGRCGDEIAEGLKQKGRFYRSKARWGEALAAYRIALEVYSEAANVSGLADIHNSMGIAHFEQGDWDEAESQYLQSLELIEDRSPELRAKIYNNMGALYNARGDFDNAMSCYLRSIPDFQTTGNQLGLAQAYHNLGMSFADKEDWQSAEKYYDLSLEISQRMEVDDLSALTYLNLASLFVSTDSPAQAEEYCRLAIAMLLEVDDRLGLAEAHKVMGVVERILGNWSESRSHFEFSIEMNEKCSSPLGLAEAYYEFGTMCRDADQTEEAHGHFSKSLAIFEQLKASRHAESVRSEVGKLDTLYLEVIEALGTAVEKKDSYTMGHSSRVAHYALTIAENLGLDEETSKGIVIGAYLHDIGKIHIADEILNKPGKLTKQEFDEIKRHPEMGVSSLRAVEFPWQVKQYILHHHERYDGSGYPSGLRGEEIPLGARIICIADFFDAMTTDRSYRKAWSQEQTIKIISQNRGVIFDRKVADCFLGLVEQHSIEAVSGTRFRMVELWKRFSSLTPVAFSV